MRSLRTRLAVLTAVLLMQQALALAFAGVRLCCDLSPGQAAATMECCENAAEGHMCPLSGRRAPEGGCRIRSGCAVPTSGALAGAGFVYAAPLVAPFSIVGPDVLRTVWRLELSADPVASVSPPSPPPKA